MKKIIKHIKAETVVNKEIFECGKLFLKQN